MRIIFILFVSLQANTSFAKISFENEGPLELREAEGPLGAITNHIRISGSEADQMKNVFNVALNDLVTENRSIGGEFFKTIYDSYKTSPPQSSGLLCFDNKPLCILHGTDILEPGSDHHLASKKANMATALYSETLIKALTVMKNEGRLPEFILSNFGGDWNAVDILLTENHNIDSN